jgi:hypothetical protein
MHKAQSHFMADGATFTHLAMEFLRIVTNHVATISNKELFIRTPVSGH